jgi:AbrB family looped-hinge helix DNA binding protein
MGRRAGKRPFLARATLTKKGQITLPSSVRRDLGIGPGDQIGFRSDGRVLPLPRVAISALAGVMPPRSGRSRTIQELRQEIADDLGEQARPASAAQSG